MPESPNQRFSDLYVHMNPRGKVVTRHMLTQELRGGGRASECLEAPGVGDSAGPRQAGGSKTLVPFLFSHLSPPLPGKEGSLSLEVWQGLLEVRRAGGTIPVPMTRGIWLRVANQLAHLTDRVNDENGPDQTFPVLCCLSERTVSPPTCLHCLYSWLE